MDLQVEFKEETGQSSYDLANVKYNEYYVEWLEERIEQLRRDGVSNRYSIDDIEKCVENWGMCKVEKEYIERFLNGC